MDPLLNLYGLLFHILPLGPGPSPFSFLAKTVLRSDKMDMSHFLKEMPEQILMRYQVKGMIDLLLSYVIWVTYAKTTWGLPTAHFIILKNGAAIYW